MGHKLACYFILASIAEYTAGTRTLMGKSCKRGTELKPTRQCPKKEDYNGLQDIDVIAPNATDLAAIGRCVAAFVSSGFDVYDFENYSKWIGEDTTMMIADTGFWRGVEGVLEYVQLALTPGPCESKPFVTNIIPTGYDNMLPVLAEGNECRLFFAATVTFQNKCLFCGDIEAILGNRYSFTIVDDAAPAKILLKRWDLYFPSGLLGYIATASKTMDYATKVCETMQSSCPKTFKKNCYNVDSGVGKCVNELLSLPATDYDGPTFTGKSFGCRYLHSLLAATNNNHCAHISFDPEFDPKCFVKCQQALEVTNSDMFHPIELGFVAAEAAIAGLPVEQWKITGSEDC